MVNGLFVFVLLLGLVPLSEFEVHPAKVPMGRMCERAEQVMPGNLSIGTQIAGRVSLSSNAARLSGRCLS
jgi:hypothetical protein